MHFRMFVMLEWRTRDRIGLKKKNKLKTCLLSCAISSSIMYQMRTWSTATWNVINKKVEGGGVRIISQLRDAGESISIKAQELHNSRSY